MANVGGMASVCVGGEQGTSAWISSQDLASALP